MDSFNEELGLNIPGHVAVILDGNGRWAKKRHMPRTYGHMQGSKVVEDMLYVADDLGVKYFTVYAFSTENWKRSTDEVSTLMNILRKYLKDCVKKSMKNNVRCRVIGRKEELSADIIESINNLEEKTKNNTGLNFTIAINYGGRDEIVRAVQKIADKVKAGEIAPGDIDESMISSNLDTAELPDPDLLIRTSGELRISNFLLWQLAYTEFYFLHTLSQMLFEISETAEVPQISLFLTLFQYALTLPVTDMRTADCSADAIIPKIPFQSYIQYQFSAFFHTVLFQLKQSAHRSFLSCEVPNCVS